MLNIQFPDTNLVECVFSFRQNNNQPTSNWDELDHLNGCAARKLKRYVYQLPDHLVGKVLIGDAVLVHCQTGYQVAEVMSINAISNFDDKSFAPIVCKLDMQSYFDGIYKKKELEAMKRAIDAKRKSLESMITYELIAEKNPEFAAMLKAFKDAGGQF